MDYVKDYRSLGCFIFFYRTTYFYKNINPFLLGFIFAFYLHYQCIMQDDEPIFYELKKWIFLIEKKFIQPLIDH